MALPDLVIAMKAKVDGVKAEFDKVPSYADDAADEATSRFGKLEGGLKAAAGAAAAAAGAALAAGVLEGMERGRLEDKTAAALRLSGPQAEQAGAIAGSLFADAYGGSMEEVQSAVGMVASELADLGSGEVEGITAKALDLAAAFDRDVASGVGEASALIADGLAADATEAFDLIAAGAQTIGPRLADELGEAAVEYAKHFADIGLSGEEMYALLGQADDQFELDKIGDSIKELSIRAADGSTATVEAFQAIGLDADRMGDAIAAGGADARGAFDEIVSGLQGIEDPADRAQAAVALFGTPVEDLGTAKIPAFLDSLSNLDGGLGDVTGRAAELGATLNNNASTKIESAKRSVQGLFASVVEMDGAVGAAATGLAGFGAAIGPIAPAASLAAAQYAGSIGKMVASAASGAASAIASGATWVASTVAQGAAAAASMAATAGQFVARYAAMAAASLASAAKMAASWVIAMGPVGWVIAAVVALVALIVANWDKVKEWTGKIWSWVTDKIAASWQWIKDTTQAAVAAVVGFFTGLRDKAVAKVNDLKRRAVELFVALKTLVQVRVQQLRDRVVGFFTGLRDSAVERVNGLKQRVQSAFTEAKNKVVSTVGSLKRKVVEFFGDLKDGAVDKATSLVDFVRSLPDKIRSAIGNLGTLLLRAGRNVVQGLIDGITAKVGALRRKAESLASTIRNFLPFSPAKEGPLSGRGSPDRAGAKIVSMVADGMGDNLAMLERMSQRAAAAAMPDVGTVTIPRANRTVGAGAATAAGFAAAGAGVEQHVTFVTSGDVRTDARHAALTLRTHR